MWRDAGSKLGALLGFLTGDKFSLEWSPGRRLAPFGSHKLMLPSSGYDSICLFSGGLDSLTGAFRLLEEGRRVLLVGHLSDGQASTAQYDIYRGLQQRFGRRVDFVQCSLARSRIGKPKFPLREKVDRDHRSRSFLFLALGVAVAAATGAEDLVLAEKRADRVEPSARAVARGQLDHADCASALSAGFRAICPRDRCLPGTDLEPPPLPEQDRLAGRRAGVADPLGAAFGFLRPRHNQRSLGRRTGYQALRDIASRAFIGEHR